MTRLSAASRPPLGVSLLYWLSWLGYLAGIFQVFGTPYVSQYYAQFWLGFGVTLGSLVVIVSLGRYIRRKKVEQLTAAVAYEHALYSARQPQLSWTLVNYGWRQVAVEIEVASAAQQQVAFLQQQLNAAMAAQQQQIGIVDQQIAFQQQQAAMQAMEQQQQQQQWVQWQPLSQYPTVVQPSPYAPAYGAVFAHPPPPQYVGIVQQPQTTVPPYAPHAAELKQPLIRY
jgi:hypothetical protein